MKSLTLIVIVIAAISCNGEAAADSTPVSTDTLMDTAIISRKADTTIEKLDNISDSIKMMREKAEKESE